MTPFSTTRGPPGARPGRLNLPWPGRGPGRTAHSPLANLRQHGPSGYRGPRATRLPHTPEPITHRPAGRWDHREGTQSHSSSREALTLAGQAFPSGLGGYHHIGLGKHSSLPFLRASLDSDCMSEREPGDKLRYSGCAGNPCPAARGGQRAGLPLASFSLG